MFELTIVALVRATTISTGSTVEDLQCDLLEWAGPTRCAAGAGQSLAARSAHTITQNAPPVVSVDARSPVGDGCVRAPALGATAPVRDRAGRRHRAVPVLGDAGPVTGSAARRAAVGVDQPGWRQS